MRLVCISLSVWVLWAMGNIDRGYIWDWYVLVYLSIWVLWAMGNVDRGDIWDWYVVV